MCNARHVINVQSFPKKNPGYAVRTRPRRVTRPQAATNQRQTASRTQTRPGNVVPKKVITTVPGGGRRRSAIFPGDAEAPPPCAARQGTASQTPFRRSRGRRQWIDPLRPERTSPPSVRLTALHTPPPHGLNFSAKRVCASAVESIRAPVRWFPGRPLARRHEPFDGTAAGHARHLRIPSPSPSAAAPAIARFAA